MKYAKTDPEVRMLMRSLDTKESAGFVASVFPSPAGETLIPLLVVLRRDRPPETLKERSWMRVGPSTWVVNVRPSDIDLLDLADEVSYFERGPALALALDETIPELALDNLSGIDPKERGSGVIIGVIDDGLDWRQPDFIDEFSRSRVLYLWDQNLTRTADDPPFEDSAQAWIGVEYTSSYLTRALTDPDTTVRHVAKAHGTHVTGIAAGNGRSGWYGANEGKSYEGVAPEAGIIFVAMRRGGTETITNSADVAAAVEYIFAKAASKKRPCVINLSLGQNLGAHDSESLLERTIDDHLTRGGYAAVIAAGNEHQPPSHACGQLGPDGNTELQLRIAADHAATQRTKAEIWYSPVDEFSIQIQCPHDSHPPLQVIRPPFSDTLWTECGVTVFIDSVRFAPENGEARIAVTIAGPKSPGVWSFRIDAQTSRDGRYDAWVERTALGLTQPEFIGAGTDAHQRISVTTPATARRCVTVGNFSRSAGSVAAASGRGTTRDGRRKPDLVAPGSNIWSTKSGGSPDAGVRTRMSGTSMSTPFVTGVVALMLQKNPDLTSWTIRSILRAAADPPQRPDGGFGDGSLNARRALELTPPGEQAIAPEDLRE